MRRFGHGALAPEEPYCRHDGSRGEDSLRWGNAITQCEQKTDVEQQTAEHASQDRGRNVRKHFGAGECSDHKTAGNDSGNRQLDVSLSVVHDRSEGEDRQTEHGQTCALGLVLRETEQQHQSGNEDDPAADAKQAAQPADRDAEEKQGNVCHRCDLVERRREKTVLALDIF